MEFFLKIANFGVHTTLINVVEIFAQVGIFCQLKIVGETGL